MLTQLCVCVCVCVCVCMCVCVRVCTYMGCIINSGVCDLDLQPRIHLVLNHLTCLVAAIINGCVAPWLQ